MKYFPLASIISIIILIGYGCESPTEQKIAFKNTDNTVYTRLPAEPDRINPCLATSTYSRIVYEQVFLNLLHFDPNTLQLSPQLAKSRPAIETLPDGQVAYTFEIHEQATWDNGSPITGEDYAFTLKVLLNPNVKAAHIRSYLEFISDFKIDPDNNKKFTVFTDGTYIIGEAVISGITPIPAYFYDPDNLLAEFSVKEMTDEKTLASINENGDQLKVFAEAFNGQEYSREKISGSGPYRFIEWETGQRIVLERKEEWWGNEMAGEFPLLEAKPDKLVFRIIPDQNAMIAALKDQQIDVASQIDPRSFVELQENEIVKDYFELHTPSSLVYYYIGMNNNDPKLADKRVRRALAHLVNVDELIETLFYGFGERLVGPIHPAKAYYNRDLNLIEYNPEKARALLAEAGWEDSNNNGIVDKEIDGQQVELEIDYTISNASKFATGQSAIFKEDAKKAGISINIVPKEFSVLIEDTKRRDYEMYSGAWGQDPTVDDPKQLWHSESDTPDGGNRVSFSNAEVDRLIEEIRLTLDEEKRNELLKEFQRLIYEEQPYIFLIAPKDRIAISKRFEASTSTRRPGFFVNTFELQTD
jgi:peptide/nickel transport system substrate-binding protein